MSSTVFATTNPPARRTARRWTGLVGTGIGVYRARRTRQLSDLAYWKRDTARLQVEQLRTNLKRAAGAEIGRENGFASIAARRDADLVRAYRDALPIADWYAFKDRIARMRERGEHDVLWPGLVRDFAQTSGTTAGDKFIPISKEMLRSNFLASLDIFSHLARFGVSLPRLTTGKALFLGGSTNLSENAHGVRTGDLSGLVVPLIRWPISEIYLPGPKIALMDHWPSKLDAMASACLDEDVRMISGMPSWTGALFEKVIELARAKGRRATRVLDVWPHLEVFVHGGVKYAPFRPRLGELLTGSDAGDFGTRLELYPASEGFIAMQDTRGDPGLRLMSDIGNFYEFVPLEEIDSPSARVFTCSEVEKGQKYVVVMSTCAGLWRYVIGDVVEFDSIPAGLDGRGGDGPCRMRIVGRHRHFINAFGENLIGEHIENAVASAARACGWRVGEFTAAPVYPSTTTHAGLELAIEAEDAPGMDAAAFARVFDDALKAQNVDYTTKRTDDLGMAIPTVTTLPRGTIDRWMASRGKLGGQHKCPRCANHREILDAIVSFAQPVA